MKMLILLTRSGTLALLDGHDHPSGFWAEELVVPYERFVAEGWDVDVATIGGATPIPDEGSLTVGTVSATRPAGTEDTAAEDVAHYRKIVETLPVLRGPLDVADIGPVELAGYDGVYISGGHGAMQDFPHDQALTSLLRHVLDRDMPLAAVCHGHSALLPLRTSTGAWQLAGRRMTAFSHDEELVTDMAGELPFVLQVELERLGAVYEKAPVIWGSCVVADGNLLTGQNPFSSAELADKFVEKLSAR